MSKLTVAMLAQAIIDACQPFVTEGETSTVTTDNVVKLDTGESKPQSGQEARSHLFENEVWALDSGKEFYIPWNKEIHSTSKAVNADGTFRKLKGKSAPSADEFITKEGGWLDKFGLEADEYELVDGKPVALNADSDDEVEEEVKKKPSKPGKPNKPGAKKPPVKKPGAKKPPQKKGEDFQAKALEHINALTNDYDVDYDFLVDQLLSEFDVESFEELPEEHNKAVYANAKAWHDWLNSINSIREQCVELDKIEGGDDGIAEGFDFLLGEFGFEALGEIARENLSEVEDSVKDHHKDWANYYKDVEAE